MSAVVAFWSVVQTMTRREDFAVDHLEDAGYETFLPKIKIRSPAVKSKIEPLFPGYVFVRIVERWYAAAWAAGVVRLIMAGEHPAHCPDAEITKIMRAIGTNGLVRLPEPQRPDALVKGVPVRILTGSFQGLTAIYAGTSARVREIVLLDLLGQRAVPVELASTDRIVRAA
jgi:transcription antitermination factor NusG